MPLPKLYTQEKIPVTKRNILTQTDLDKWPYLQEIKVREIDTDVELLIGVNTPKAMEPWKRQVTRERCFCLHMHATFHLRTWKMLKTSFVTRKDSISRSPHWREESSALKGRSLCKLDPIIDTGISKMRTNIQTGDGGRYNTSPTYFGNVGPRKWNKIRRDFVPGDLVVIIDNSASKHSWPLGQVIKTLPGPKGLVCSVLVKAKTNVIQQPVTKLCLLLEA